MAYNNHKLYCKDPSKLQYDEACLNIFTHDNEHPVTLYKQLEECYRCNYEKWVTIPQESNISLLVNTNDRLLFHMKDFVGGFNCSQSYKFEQHGIYGWNITDSECSSVYVIKPPNNAYLPLYVLLFMALLMLIVRISSKILQNAKCVSTHRSTNLGSPLIENEDDHRTPTNEMAPIVQSELIPCARRIQKTRISSLDVFRGITITMMIFVNYGGGKYWILKHSSWNGLTVADVIFPWFAWIMGVGIVLSVRSQLRSGMSRRKIYYKSYKRTIRLLLLGFLASNFGSNRITTLRFPGVLQRLGISYFVVALMETALMKRQPNFQYGRWVIIQDFLDSWIQWLFIIVIAVIHTLITFKLHVPGCPTGYLGPGGLHDFGAHVNCTGGAAGYIDRHIFGENHIYQHPKSAVVYHSIIPFDPEGLLGILTTILTVYLGVAAGRVILCWNSNISRVKRWLIYALVCGLAAGCLSGWSKEGGFIPVNKGLWSLSFVFLTASMAFVMLTILFLFVDHYALWSGYPMSQAGMNAVLLYMGHEIMRGTFPWSWSPISSSTHVEFVIMNAVGTWLWIATGIFLAKNDVFLSI